MEAGFQPAIAAQYMLQAIPALHRIFGCARSNFAEK